MGGDFGSLWVEVGDDPLAVDTHGDRLANVHVVPRFDRVVEPEVEGVQAFALIELDVRISLDRRDVIGARVVDAIDGTRLELEPALGGLIAPAELDVRRLGLVAPVGVVGIQDQAVALLP